MFNLQTLVARYANADVRFLYHCHVVGTVTDCQRYRFCVLANLYILVDVLLAKMVTILDNFFSVLACKYVFFSEIRNRKKNAMTISQGVKHN